MGVWGWGGGAICVRVPARLPFARACPRLPAQPRLACALILVTLTGLHIGVPRSLRGSVPRDLKGRACVPRGSRARACVRASVLVSVGLSSSTLSLSLSLRDRSGQLTCTRQHTQITRAPCAYPVHTDTCTDAHVRAYAHTHTKGYTYIPISDACNITHKCLAHSRTHTHTHTHTYTCLTAYVHDFAIYMIYEIRLTTYFGNL